MNRHVKEFSVNGFKVVIDYDPFSYGHSPREWALSKWYGVDNNAPSDLILDEDGKIDPSCDELKDKFWFKVYKYEHSAVSFSLVSADKWDSSFFGIIAISKDEVTTKDEAMKRIEAELDLYTNWCNGEVYGYRIYDESNPNIEVDSCWDYFSIDECEADAKDMVICYAEQKKKDSVRFWANNAD